MTIWAAWAEISRMAGVSSQLPDELLTFRWSQINNWLGRMGRACLKAFFLLLFGCPVPKSCSESCKQSIFTLCICCPNNPKKNDTSFKLKKTSYSRKPQKWAAAPIRTDLKPLLASTECLSSAESPNKSGWPTSVLILYLSLFARHVFKYGFGVLSPEPLA